MHFDRGGTSKVCDELPIMSASYSNDEPDICFLCINLRCMLLIEGMSIYTYWQLFVYTFE